MKENLTLFHMVIGKIGGKSQLQINIYDGTVKSNSGIKDLDSETELVEDSLYNVTVLYDGNDYEIYINGELDAFTSFSGLILTTSIDLMIGQVLPGNNQYNFNGVLDDIRIYNYALSYGKIRDLYDFATDIKDQQENKTPENYSLLQNYPNPFNSQTIIWVRYFSVLF